MNNALLKRFLTYVKIDTQSSEETNTSPSTMKQFDLLNLLKKELDDLGVENELTKEGRLYAHIEGNDKYYPIGLCSHVDTALEISGKDVKPQIITYHKGEDVLLGKSGYKLSPNEFPILNSLDNKTLITTDGTTLLGADDKAGVAIIMEVVTNHLKLNKDNRRPLSILFTPDEEIGRGPEYFDSEKYNCKFAFTVDGGYPKEIEIENFNASSIDVLVKGCSIHPGYAYGYMVNAGLVLSHLISLLDLNKTPEKTKDREGFNHVVEFKGNVEEAKAHIIIRNHDQKLLEEQIKDIYLAKDATLKLFPNAEINLVRKDQYKNMYEIIKNHPEITAKVEKAFKELGVTDFSYKPIRGGTDGATFSFLGTPCPNIGTGSYNHHGRFEFAVLEEMEFMVSLIGKILDF